MIKGEIIKEKEVIQALDMILYSSPKDMTGLLQNWEMK